MEFDDGQFGVYDTERKMYKDFVSPQYWWSPGSYSRDVRTTKALATQAYKFLAFADTGTMHKVVDVDKPEMTIEVSYGGAARLVPRKDKPWWRFW